MATWPAYRLALGRYLDAITTFQAEFAAITPPVPLKRSHAQLLRSWKLFYEELEYGSEHLRLRDPYGQWWRGWEARNEAVRRLVHEWAVAIKAEGLRQHVRVPKALTD